MLRVIVLVLVAATLLSAGPTRAERLTKQEYVAAATRASDASALDRLADRALDFELPGQMPTRQNWLVAERELRGGLLRAADRLDALKAPAEVASNHAAWVWSLRFCARRLEQLERTSPLDPVIVERFMEPCFVARSRVCDRFYDRGYWFS